MVMCKRLFGAYERALYATQFKRFSIAIIMAIEKRFNYHVESSGQVLAAVAWQRDASYPPRFERTAGCGGSS
jgi:hypothetical protein